MTSNAKDTPDEDWNLSEKVHFEKRFHRLAENEISSDCEFKVGSQNVVIKGHKAIFSAASDVFDAMFYGQLKEDKHVEIEDLDPEGFQGLKQFIYTGEVNFISVIQALKTYIAARKYIISQLIKECRKFIKENIQPSEVLEIYEYCNIHNISEFNEICFETIQKKTDEVVGSDYFLAAKIDTIELILKSPSLKLKSEIELFDHFERWAFAEAERKKIAVEEMASSFNSLKKHIRFSTLNINEFVTKVEESLFLTLEEKYAISLNLLKTNSKPIPENLSAVQQERDFTLFKSENHLYVKTIEISVRSINLVYYNRLPDIFNGDVKIRGNYSKSKDTITFKVKSSSPLAFRGVLIMRAKLEAVVEELGECVFEEEYKVFLSSEIEKFGNIPVSRFRDLGYDLMSIILSVSFEQMRLA